MPYVHNQYHPGVGVGRGAGVLGGRRLVHLVLEGIIEYVTLACAHAYAYIHNMRATLTLTFLEVQYLVVHTYAAAPLPRNVIPGPGRQADVTRGGIRIPGDQQRQVHPQLLISGTVVRVYVRPYTATQESEVQ